MLWPPSGRDMNHWPADVDDCRHVLREQPAHDGIERSEHVVEGLVPPCPQPDASPRLDVAWPENEGRLEREQQQRVLGFAFDSRPHRPPAFGAVGTFARDVTDRETAG